MSLSVGLTVVGSGVLHAVWNAIAKQLEDRLLTLALIGIPLTALGAVMVVSAGVPPQRAAWLAAASALVHVVYDVALMSSYRLGALNHVYPIARGISPLAVTVGAYLFAHERLALGPSLGIAILAAGLVSLALSDGLPGRAELPAVGAAVLTGLTIATYSLIDGLGVRHAHNPFSYGGLLFLLLGPVFPIEAAVRRRRVRGRRLPVLAGGLSAGVLLVGAYTLVLWAQTRAPLAIVASLRETSVIFAALIGTLVFKERFGARRIVAAFAVASGIALISV